MRFAAFFLALLLAVAFSSARLLSVNLVSRHGTRAPNPVVDSLCPNDKANLARYLDMEISLSGLTGKGMVELFELGAYTKQKYITNNKFLDSYFDNKEMYVRAVGEDRTLQSAVAWSQALYGPGQSAKGYYADLPAPVPVYTIPDEMDNLLEVRKAACHDRLKDDVKTYDATRLVELYAEHAGLIAEIGQMCGVDLNEAIQGSGDNLGDAIKDITDAFTFDVIEGFTPLPGLTMEKLLAFRAVAVEQLIGRILGTEEQITYLNGALPSTMRDSFLAAIEGNSNALKFTGYHGHREMLYAVGKYYGIDYNIDFPGLPKGAIPPATSLFFELHEQDAVEGGAVSHVVKVFLWIPCNGNDARTRPLRASGTAEPADSHHWERSEGLDCPAEQVQLASCAALDCTWEEFLAIEENRIKQTGTWESLCDFQPETSKLAEPTAHYKLESAIQQPSRVSGSLVLGLSAITVFMAGAAFMWKRRTDEAKYELLP